MTNRSRVPARLLVLATLTYAVAAQATLPVQQWQTASGARVLFVETHDLPMLDVAVDFPAGVSRDTREKSGLAALTLRMLQLGAEGLDEDQIAERLADVGADIGGRFDMDRAGYGLRTLSSARERDEAMAVLLRILQRPTFPQPIFEREKERVLAAPEGIRYQTRDDCRSRVQTPALRRPSLCTARFGRNRYGRTAHAR